MVRTVGNFGGLLGRLVRGVPGPGLTRKAGQMEQHLEFRLCPEGEVESLKDSEQKHDLEGSARSCDFRQINVSMRLNGGLVSHSVSPKTGTPKSPPFICHSAA